MSNIFQCSNSAGRLYSTLSINKDLKSITPCHAVGCYSITVSFKLSGFWQLLSQAMLGKSAQARGSPLQMDGRSWGPHMLYSTLHLPIWPLWQHKGSVDGHNFGGEKNIYKSWWFPSIILCRSQGRVLYERRRWAALEQVRKCPPFWTS